MNWIVIVGGLVAVAGFLCWIYGRKGLLLAFGMFALALICALADRYAGPNSKWIIAAVLLPIALLVEWRRRKNNK